MSRANIHKSGHRCHENSPPEKFPGTVSFSRRGHYSRLRPLGYEPTGRRLQFAAERPLTGLTLNAFN
jgi:hypothetical protein